MSWWQVFRCELKSIYTNSALLLTVFGGVVMNNTQLKPRTGKWS